MEIHWVHVEELDDADRAAAERRFQTLAEGHSDLVDLRVVGKSTGHHRLGAREIRITCQARGRDIVAVRTRPEISLALHDALEAFENEVRKLRQRRRDRRMQAPAPPPLLGIIDRVFPEEGYGFILTDGGEQVYFHRNAVQGGLDFDALDEGQRVGLDLEGGEKGPQATNVVAPPPDAPSP